MSVSSSVLLSGETIVHSGMETLFRNNCPNLLLGSSGTPSFFVLPATGGLLIFRNLLKNFSCVKPLIIKFEPSFGLQRDVQWFPATSASRQSLAVLFERQILIYGVSDDKVELIYTHILEPNFIPSRIIPHTSAVPTVFVLSNTSASIRITLSMRPKGVIAKYTPLIVVAQEKSEVTLSLTATSSSANTKFTVGAVSESGVLYLGRANGQYVAVLEPQDGRRCIVVETTRNRPITSVLDIGNRSIGFGGGSNSGQFKVTSIVTHDAYSIVAYSRSDSVDVTSSGVFGALHNSGALSSITNSALSKQSSIGGAGSGGFKHILSGVSIHDALHVEVPNCSIDSNERRGYNAISSESNGSAGHTDNSGVSIFNTHSTRSSSDIRFSDPHASSGLTITESSTSVRTDRAHTSSVNGAAVVDKTEEMPFIRAVASTASSDNHTSTTASVVDSLFNIHASRDEEVMRQLTQAQKRQEPPQKQSGSGSADNRSMHTVSISTTSLSETSSTVAELRVYILDTNVTCTIPAAVSFPFAEADATQLRQLVAVPVHDPLLSKPDMLTHCALSPICSLLAVGSSTSNKIAIYTIHYARDGHGRTSELNSSAGTDAYDGGSHIHGAKYPTVTMVDEMVLPEMHTTRGLLLRANDECSSSSNSGSNSSSASRGLSMRTNNTKYSLLIMSAIKIAHKNRSSGGDGPQSALPLVSISTSSLCEYKVLSYDMTRCVEKAVHGGTGGFMETVSPVKYTAKVTDTSKQLGSERGKETSVSSPFNSSTNTSASNGYQAILAAVMDMKTTFDARLDKIETKLEDQNVSIRALTRKVDLLSTKNTCESSHSKMIEYA